MDTVTVCKPMLRHLSTRVYAENALAYNVVGVAECTRG
jgi:hypothetical protein